MTDPFDDDPPVQTGSNRVDRVRARTSVTSPRQPTASGEGDSQGSQSGKTAAAPRPAPPPPPPPQPVASRNRSGLTVVRASDIPAAAPAPPAPTLAPSLLPPRRVTTAPPGPSPAPPPLVDLDSLLSPGPPPPVPMALDDLLAPAAPPPPPALSTSSAPRPAPPPPATPPRPAGLDPQLEPSGSRIRPAIESSGPTKRPTGLMGLDPPVEPSTPTKRPTGLMGLDPPVEPSNPTRRPTGLMGLDPPVEPSNPTRRPTGLRSLDPPVEGSNPTQRPAPPARVASNPALQAMGIADDDGPPMAPRAPIPTGLREDGTALSAAEAALPSLFKTPEQIQRRRIQIAATGVAGIVLAVVTVVMWIANRPPPPRTGSTQFAVADKAAVTDLYLASVSRLDNTDVQPVVARIVASVARSLLPKDAPPPGLILSAEKEVVAFATPDGRLVISHGMLRTLQSQAELAALAAHLLTHQLRYHLDDALDAEAKALLPDTRVALTSRLATPGSTRVATVDLWHTFSDAEEQEADTEAVLALQRAAWDPTALRTLWERLETLAPKPGLVVRHPLTPTRLAALGAAEKLRLKGSDLIKGDGGRTNSAEYQSQIKDVLDPPVIATAAPAEPTPPPPSSEPVATRITTAVVEPKVAPKKPPPPAPPPAPTPRSPRDPND